MSRTDLDWRDRLPRPTPANVLIVGGLCVVVGVTFALALRNDLATAPASTPVSPYENCLLAANDPGPSGYATEVCEPLSPFWKDPAVLLYPADMDPGGCGTTPKGVRWCPVDLTPDRDGCLTFTYAMLHGEPQEKWGDPGDGEVFCTR